jgi:hypothetical protein
MRDSETLKIKHMKEMTAISAAHKKEVEQLEVMHALDKSYIEKEIQNTKWNLENKAKELSQTKKTPEIRKKERMKFLQEQRADIE